MSTITKKAFLCSLSARHWFQQEQACIVIKLLFDGEQHNNSNDCAELTIDIHLEETDQTCAKDISLNRLVLKGSY